MPSPGLTRGPSEPPARHPGGAPLFIPRTDRDARADPRIKAGDRRDETECAALIFWRRDSRAPGETPAPLGRVRIRLIADYCRTLGAARRETDCVRTGKSSCAGKRPGAVSRRYPARTAWTSFARKE